MAKKILCYVSDEDIGVIGDVTGKELVALAIAYKKIGSVGFDAPVKRVSLDDVMVRLDGIVSLLGGNQYNSSKISLRGSTDTKVTPSTDSSMMDKLMAIASGNNVKEEQKTTLTAKEQTILSQISGLTSGYKKSHWEDGEEYTPKQMFARNGVDYLRDEYGK